MPPGRPGYTTIKTIEENLRSKAGQLGGTRKEVPMRLERLEAMGLFKRESRPRGTGHVEVGELVMDHPLIPSLTDGVTRTEARPQRLPRQPRSAAPRQAAAQPEAAGETEVAPEPTRRLEAPPAPEVADEDIELTVAEPQPQPEPEAEPEREPAPAPSAPAARTETVEATPFRWVTSAGTPEVAEVGATSAKGEPKAKAERAAAKPRKRTPRKTPTTRASSRSKKTAPAEEAEAENTTVTEPTNDLTTPV